MDRQEYEKIRRLKTPQQLEEEEFIRQQAVDEYIKKQEEEQRLKEEEEKQAAIKYPTVSRWRCLKTIIFCLIVACTAFIPFVINNGEIIFTFQKLPFINGNGITDSGLAVAQNQYALGFMSMFKFASVNNTLLTTVGLSGTIFFLVLIVDILFAIILMILPYNPIRIIFRIFSILFAFVMLTCAISFIISMVGFIGYLYQSATNIEEIMANFGPAFLSSGFIFFLVATVFAFTLIGKQFRWFAARPY